MDRGAFTFTDYNLDVHVTPATQSLTAKGTVRLRNDSKTPQRRAFLQVSSTLEWKSVLQDGKPVQYQSVPYTTDIDHTGAVSEAIVTLARPSAPGEVVNLEVEYGGAVVQDATRLTRIGYPESMARHNDWDQIGEQATIVRGVGYVTWYPVSIEAVSLSNGNEVFQALGAWKRREAGASLRVSLWYPKGSVLVANNPPTSTARGAVGGASEGIAPTVFMVGVDYLPLGQTVPTFVIGQYEEVAEAQAGTVAHYLPGHVSAASDYARTAGGVWSLASIWFGTRKRQVHIVELPDPDDTPFDSGAILFTPLKTMDRKTLQVMLAHQMAHASFDSPRGWIYEGAATFAQALEREQQDGRDAALDYMQEQVSLLAATEKQARAGGADAREQPLLDATDEVLVRTKAMFVWWMLRDMLGDAALQQVFRQYRAADDTSPAYLQKLLEAEGKKPLQWFFDDWVYKDRGLPDLQIESATAVPTVAGAYAVTVTAENRGDAAVDVPIVVNAEGGKRVGRLRIGGKQKAFVRIAVPALPTEATINDGSVPESGNGTRTVKVEVGKQ